MKAKVKMVRMNLRVDDDLAYWLRRIAKIRGTSISSVVRGLLTPAYNARYRKA